MNKNKRRNNTGAWLSEALVGCLGGQTDLSDDMYGLLTGLAVDDSSIAASEMLLQNKNLPLELAQKLVARRGVSAAELAAYAARGDLPAETLTSWVRKERRVTVLAQIAAKPDLAPEIYETLATREGLTLRSALLVNESVPIDVRAEIAADMINTSAAHASLHELHQVMTRNGLMQRAVFPRLDPDVPDRYVSLASKWEGLTTSQSHALLDAVEQYAATLPPGPANGARQNQYKADNARQQARSATCGLAAHPSADTELLDRIEQLVTVNPTCNSSTLDEAVLVARRRLALLGGSGVQLHAASYSKLVELADSGVLTTVSATQRAIRNPLFDAEVAVHILDFEKRSGNRDFAIERALRDWAPNLLSSLRVQRAMDKLPAFASGLSEHVASSTFDELVEALHAVADDPSWRLRLAQEITEADILAADPAVDDAVVGQFGWFPDHAATFGNCNQVGALTFDYLYRRFGSHIPTWRVFSNIADSSTSLADAAALAIHAEPLPDLLTVQEPETPVHTAPSEQSALF